MPLDSSLTLGCQLLLQRLKNIGRDSENDVCLHGRLGPELFYPSFWSTATWPQNLPYFQNFHDPFTIAVLSALAKSPKGLQKSRKKTFFKLLVETIVGQFSVQQILMLSLNIFNYIECPLIQAVWLSRGRGGRATALWNWWVLPTLGWILAVTPAVVSWHESCSTIV